jgi:hypothetical protein
MTVARSVDTATPLADGRVLVTGGSNGDRNFATATLLRDGRVLVARGYDDRIRSTAATWLFTP